MYFYNFLSNRKFCIYVRIKMRIFISFVSCYIIFSSFASKVFPKAIFQMTLKITMIYDKSNSLFQQFLEKTFSCNFLSNRKFCIYTRIKIRIFISSVGSFIIFSFFLSNVFPRNDFSNDIKKLCYMIGQILFFCNFIIGIVFTMYRSYFYPNIID